MYPYSIDWYKAHACEHAIEDLTQRIGDLYFTDLQQNKDLGVAKGTIEPFQNQLTPIDEKACRNDSRTAENEQTDMNQDAELEYLEDKVETLTNNILTLMMMLGQ